MAWSYGFIFAQPCDKVWLFIVLFIRQKALKFVWDRKAPFLEEQKETWAVREGETEGETAWLLFPAPQEKVVLGQSVLRPGHRKPGWLGTLKATPLPEWRQGVPGAELGARSRQAQCFLSGKAALLLVPQLLSWEGGSSTGICCTAAGKLQGMCLPAC